MSILRVAQRAAVLRPGLRAFSTSAAHNQALKIAYFGSDWFSIKSLQAVLQLQKDDPGAIESVKVVTKPPKRAGRGLKELKDVPIADFALENGLQVLRADNKKEINELPNDFSLVVAVSYGGLIPQQFLANTKYGGLNVHPSFLPQYHGPAPIHHAMLNGDETTGVTVQTLHPTKFDRGRVISISEKIPIARSETFESLRDTLADEGAKLLYSTIQERNFTDASYEVKSGCPDVYAGHVTSKMRAIDWSKDSAEKLERSCNTLGSLYTHKVFVERKQVKADFQERVLRVLLSDLKKVDGLETSGAPGTHKCTDGTILINTVDGVVSCPTLQVEFQAVEDANKFEKRCVGSKKKRAKSEEFVDANL
ncbi:Methionyl-tRNA formyltransferase [Yarrowia sp. B02]|nr:Methionyl-tRNA formyltransferase [Yarrowia sp. B02]